jgi:hypothetical protein
MESLRNRLFTFAMTLLARCHKLGRVLPST